MFREGKDRGEDEVSAVVSDVSSLSNSPVSTFIQHPRAFAWGFCFVKLRSNLLMGETATKKKCCSIFWECPLSFFMWLDLTTVTETSSARMTLDCGCLWLLYTDECVNMFFYLGVYHLSVAGSAVGHICLLLSFQLSLPSTEFSGTFDFLSPLQKGK